MKLNKHERAVARRWYAEAQENGSLFWATVVYSAMCGVPAAVRQFKDALAEATAAGEVI